MNADVRLSRRLAYVLRHRPGAVGLELDAGGWVDLVALAAVLGRPRECIEDVVRGDGKQRYTIVDGRIRAQQGHSVPVDLGYAPTAPPEVLWHGTVATALGAVLRDGLSRRGRHAVHLSPDSETARRVGARRGPPVVLRVDAGALHRDGAVFTVSGNGVWLVRAVPAAYLSVTQPTTGDVFFAPDTPQQDGRP